MPDQTAHSSQDDYVIRTGKVFQCGRYDDKQFEFDENDLQRAVASFEPCPVNLAHTPTVLDGKLGVVQRIYPGANGALMGDVALPKWLDSALDDSSRRVSAEWDRATKTLKKLSLVLSPRVTDAALFAAFSADFARKRHDTPSGQMAIQQIHNMAASSGAVCNQPATMASRHEHSAIQQVHDVAVSHGATCQSTANSATPPYFSGAPASQPPPTNRRNRMKFSDWLKGKATEDGVDIDDMEAAFSGANPELEAKIKAEMDAKDAKIAAFENAQKENEARFAKMAEERRQAEAVTFASGFIASKRLTPAAAEKLVPLAARIAAADSTVTFAEGEKSMSAMLQELCEALPDLSVFATEHIKSDQVAALFNATETDGVGEKKPPTQDRIDALLKATPSGRAVLAERAKSNGH